MTDFVFILFQSEACEGGSILSTHATIEGARSAMSRIAPANGMPAWKKDEGAELDAWDSGCDRLEIIKCEVLP